MPPIMIEQKKWTYEDYLNLDDEKRYEIMAGKLKMMTPAPGSNHQWISGKLEYLIRKFLEGKNLGYVMDAPLDVVLDAENVVQPDIVFISRQKREIIKKKGIFGSPDLLIEIISPSSQYRDTYEKKDLYAKYKVKEYWIVNPYIKGVEVLTLNEHDNYALFSEGYLEENVKRSVESMVLKGFVVDLNEVFKEEF
ncbi:MAG: Uma2 family endonuclease [Candidatus Brocadiaceae bacterium]